MKKNSLKDLKEEHESKKEYEEVKKKKKKIPEWCM